MNTDKIMRALRDAEGNNELDCEISELRPLLLKAADLIESLQAEIKRLYDEAETKTCAGCRWRGRHQKCSCCRRNRSMRDLYEEAGEGVAE